MCEYELYPILIYQDRYGNGWIAVANADEEDHELLKLAEDYADEKGGPFGDDNSNWFWHYNVPEWACVGATPNKAYAGLLIKYKIDFNLDSIVST